jgi:hypothetical protein
MNRGKLSMLNVIMIALVTLVSLPACARAQAPVASPAVSQLAESDALWGGNYVDQLPSCDGDELCLAVLTQSSPGERYYYGVVQNNRRDWVSVRDAIVTLFDKSGDVAAIGGIYFLAPSVISPGGHALVQVQASGEFVSEFTFEARFDYDPGMGDGDGDGMPLRIDSATVRGDAILSEFTNTSDYTFDSVWAYSACFADDGSILDIDQNIVEMGPYGNGDGDRLVFEPRNVRDCSSFVVTANGNP